MISDFLAELILYFGPFLIFFAAITWATLYLGGRAKQQIVLSREIVSCQKEMLSLLTEIKSSFKDRMG